MIYRPEIDGLRAVAVLSVLFYHGGFSVFRGGYLGVDVFFVISGFLITSIITAKISKGTFSLVEFYERRFRRILPALSFLLLLVTLMALLLLSKQEFDFFSHSLWMASLYFSNYFFLEEINYFNPHSEEELLLHTWSLSVEEQFYIFHPLLLLSIFKIRRVSPGLLLTCFGCAFFIFSRYLLSSHEMETNFYLLPGRAWELLAGAAICFLPQERLKLSPRWKKTLSTVGLLLIALPICVYNESSVHFIWRSTGAVVGTCLILLFAEGSGGVGRILAFRPVKFIGLISYSLYLWHQPLLALLRHKTIGPLTQTQTWAVIGVTFVMAFISWKWVERPFRSTNKISRANVFIFTGFTTVFFLIVGIKGPTWIDSLRKAPSPLLETAVPSPKKESCHTRGRDYLDPEKACRYNRGKVKWAGLGDSHMVELIYAMADRLESRGEAILHLTFSGCPPALTFESTKPGCNEWVIKALDVIEKDSEIENVIIGYRYSVYLYGEHRDSYPQVLKIANNSRIKKGSQADTPEKIQETYWESLREIINRLQAKGKRVYVVYPIPELPGSVVDLLAPLTILSDKPQFNSKEIVPHAFYQERNEFILNKLNWLPYSDSLIPVRTDSLFCHGQFCSVLLGSKSAYFDDNHLSVWGAKYLSDLILSRVP